MSQPIVYIDISSIREGRLDELENAIKKLVEFVEANVPQLISYEFFFSNNRMTVMAVHPDSDSIASHMDAGKEEFLKFADYIKLEKIEVYGNISDSVLEKLHKKAKALGDGSVTVHQRIGGFRRE